MYRAGTYGVAITNFTGDFHVMNIDFETEKDARVFANKQWVRSDVSEVEIFKRTYNKKRRNSILIAKASK